MKSETLADLLAGPISGRRLTAWCDAAGLRTQTVTYLLDGRTRPQRGTLALLASALNISVDRVRKACAASREKAKLASAPA